MRSFLKNIEETTTLNIRLNVVENITEYQFSILEVTTENETKHKSEINKTIFSSIKKIGTNVLEAHIETFDRDYKNKAVSITEKEFLTRLSEINDDINLNITNTGKILKINNLLFIKERAKSKIEKLKKSYVGEKVENIFNNITAFYNNEKRVILDIESYKQYGILLNKCYGLYAPNIIKKNSVRFLNFMDNTLVNVEETASIHKIDEAIGIIEIKVNGEITSPIYNSMFLQSLKNKFITIDINDKPTLNKYEGLYNFDIKTGIVKNVKLDVAFSYGKNYSKTIFYQLNETINADNN